MVDFISENGNKLTSGPNFKHYKHINVNPFPVRSTLMIIDISWYHTYPIVQRASRFEPKETIFHAITSPKRLPYLGQDDYKRASCELSSTAEEPLSKHIHLPSILAGSFSSHLNYSVDRKNLSNGHKRPKRAG